MLISFKMSASTYIFSLSKAKRQGRKLKPYDLNGHPKFKSKDETIPKFYTRNDSLYFQEDCAVLEKIGKVKFQTDLEIPIVSRRKDNKTTFINSRIKYENGKWILSFGIERENAKQELNDFSVGIDLGVKDLAVCSNGLIIKSVNKTNRVKKLEKRLQRKQRNVSRKYQTNGSFEKTSGIDKEKAKVKDLSRKLANIRLDHTHKATRQIIDLLPKKVVMEDLNVTGMMKNKHLSRAIQNQMFSKFKEQIEYKAEWAGIEYIEAERFYPSSKKCSVCGNIKKELKLRERIYECDVCGLKINRDLNAARNLERLAM